MTMDEFFDVLDAQGNPIGVRKHRDDVHRDGDWHRNVHLWIVTEYNDILLQRCTDEFYMLPYYVDVSMSGHVKSGHTSEETVVLEAQEELSIEVPLRDLHFLMMDRVQFEGKTARIERYFNKELHDVYVWRCPLNPFDFKFDTREIKGLELVTFNEFDKMVQNRDERLVPQWREYEALLWYLGGK